MDITVRVDAEKIGQPTKRDRCEFGVFGAEATITADMQQVPEGEFGGFANWASISAGGDLDEVSVSISADDPRGSFTMTMSRGPEGQLYLMVPHPSDGFPHMRLTEVRPGFYKVTPL